MINRLAGLQRERMAEEIARNNSRTNPEDDDRTIEMPQLECPYCHYLSDRATQVDSDELHIPKGGDVSICIKCAAVSIFVAPGSLRTPAEKELAEINADRVIASAVRAIKEINRKRAEEDHAE